MKKIYSLLAIFLCVGLIAPVCAFPIEKTHMDSWGRTMMIEDGECIYFGQTVAVTESSIACIYEYEVFENCTVTIETNGHVVVVDENGDRVISKNGVEFRYTSNWRITSSMTWNNFPYGGGKPVKHVEFVDEDFVLSVLNSVCNGIDYTQFPETITYGDMTFNLALPQVFGWEGYEYDYYWRTSESWTPYINILGAGPVKLYDFVEGDILSESEGLLEFYTYDEFMSALNTIDDAHEVTIITEDSNDWRNNCCVDIALHW